jgi:hypoxanthine phosphoribosyltransferase
MTPDNLELVTDLKSPINNRHVLLVEDLLDTGRTLTYMRNFILSRNPASFKICTLIKKNKLREKDIDPDYVGFEVEDKFIVGYGTDFAEEGRNLPDIYVIDD